MAAKLYHMRHIGARGTASNAGEVPLVIVLLPGASRWLLPTLLASILEIGETKHVSKREFR